MFMWLSYRGLLFQHHLQIRVDSIINEFFGERLDLIYVRIIYTVIEK